MTSDTILGSSDTSTKRDLVNRYIDAMDAFDMVRSAVDKFVEAMGVAADFGPNETARARHFVDDVLVDHRPALREAFAEIYEQHFDEADLVELVRFAESPIARRLKTLSQKLMHDFEAAAQAILSPALDSALMRAVQSGLVAEA